LDQLHTGDLKGMDLEGAGRQGTGQGEFSGKERNPFSCQLSRGEVVPGLVENTDGVGATFSARAIASKKKDGR